MRYGKSNGDFVVLMEARRLYTKALHLLRIALCDIVSLQHDDTLAAIGLMTFYEVSAHTPFLANFTNRCEAFRFQRYDAQWVGLPYSWPCHASRSTWARTTLYAQLKSSIGTLSICDGKLLALGHDIVYALMVWTLDFR